MRTTRKSKLRASLGLGEDMLKLHKTHARNRMRVFDAAPRRVREKCHEQGDAPLIKWWDKLQEHQQVAILAGERCPKRKPKEEISWQEMMADWVLRR